MCAQKGELGVEGHTTKLAFAVSLLDEYSKVAPLGPVEVSLRGGTGRAIKNPSSYYLFLDLPDDEYTIYVTSAYYFEEEVEVHTAGRDPGEPVIVRLKPTPAYPFPPGSTLIRGLVTDANGSPVSGASVEARGLASATRTTSDGEFVLHFGPLKGDSIVQEGTKRFVKGDGGDKLLHLDVASNGLTKTVDLVAEEGKTTSVVIVCP